MSSLQRLALKNKLPPMGPPRSHGRSTGNHSRLKRDFTPASWRKYWDSCRDVDVNGDIFRVYQRGSSGPLLVMLHGGGYSALTWSLFATSITDIVECQVMAFDSRGHGGTHTTDDADMSAERLARDVGNVIEFVYGASQPASVLIGHSMGGAIAVHASYQEYVVGLVGLVVIDVVEGTAMDALSSMQSFLRGRPSQFNSLQNAIEWSVRTGQTRNVESARVSMPAQIKNANSGECGTVDVEAVDDSHEAADDHESIHQLSGDTILEENDEQEISSPPQTANLEAVKKYTWRVDLAATEKFWPGWFQGLSQKFLSCTPTKLLLLAGVDRLDRDLTVGQMQGKFQMQVLPQCGHAVHEDVPERVAEVLATFLLRQKLTTATNGFTKSFPAC